MLRPRRRCSARREGAGRGNPSPRERGIRPRKSGISGAREARHSLGETRGFWGKLGGWATSVGSGGERVKNRCLAQNDHFLMVNEFLGSPLRTAACVAIKWGFAKIGKMYGQPEFGCRNGWAGCIEPKFGMILEVVSVKFSGENCMKLWLGRGDNDIFAVFWSLK